MPIRRPLIARHGRCPEGGRRSCEQLHRRCASRIRPQTLDGARYIGLDKDLGSIERGKLADLVVIEGIPLEDVRRSEYVVYTMMNGRVYDAATMDQVAPDKVKRRPYFFEKEGGDTIHPATQAWLERLRERYGWEH